MKLLYYMCDFFWKVLRYFLIIIEKASYIDLSDHIKRLLKSVTI